jgi:antibiotic biosynthesis monooxygenase (ABM) superfamily enzyme
VVTRVWHGWTTRENADAYERFLMSELFPSMRAIPGFRDADVLRREDGNEVAFITLTRFDSLEAIIAFAGEEYERAVIEPQARAVLSHYDDRAQHYSTSSYPA